MVESTRRTAGAVELVRNVGLMADGPVRWGMPARSSRPGIYLVEIPAPLPRAPIDVSPVGTWIDRVPSLLLDGHRPTGKELTQRLASFWLPDQVVLYVGATTGPLGRRIDELVRTPLGDPAPHPDGRWLKTLRGLEQARVWWAETDAPEEYQDALLAAFTQAVDPAVVGALHDPTVVVPFANMAAPGALPKEHGITADLLAAAPEVPAATRRVTSLPPGDAVSSALGMSPRGRASGGANRAPSPASRSGGTTRRSGAASRTGTSGTRAPAASSRVPRASGGSRARQAAAMAPARTPAPVHLTPEGLARLHAELDELVRIRRPEIIARVRAARELGDLSENADYEAARKEQSFAEGRISQIETMIRHAQIIEAPAAADEVALGSTVVVESSDGEETYTIVGSSEARPAEGRISNTSPLGLALMGRRAGDDVVVRAPMGDRHYRILELR